MKAWRIRLGSSKIREQLHGKRKARRETSQISKAAVVFKKQKIQMEERNLESAAGAVTPAFEGNSPERVLCSGLLSAVNACLSGRSLPSVRKTRAGS